MTLQDLPEDIAFFYACVLANLGPPPHIDGDINTYYNDFCKIRVAYFPELYNAMYTHGQGSGSFVHFAIWYKERMRESP